MLPIKKILAAIDLSKYSKATLKYACYLAESLHADLMIINVLNQRDVEAVSRVSQYAPNISVENYISSQKDERQKAIEQLLKEINTGVKPKELILRVGIPFSEILDVVHSHKIDLVVMGAKGRSDIATILLGSTSEKMLRRSPVPVIIIKTTDI
jgi:nucleotide-binding universal stress UspA family protein